MAFIISVVGQKGGIGKTTVAWNLAFALTYQDHRIKLMDCDDSQFSSKFLSKLRGKNDIDVSCMSVNNAFDFIKERQNDFDVIILECGGRVDEELKMAIAYADLVLMPLKPAALEINTVKNVENIIDNISDFRAKCFILPNMVSTHYKNKDLDDMLDLKFKYFDFTKSSLCYRSQYSSCLSQGKNIYETHDKAAIWEFNQFLHELESNG